MSRDASGSGDSVVAGIRELEGYLFWQGEVVEAQAKATKALEQFDWLTRSQRDALKDCFVNQQLECSRDYVKRVARRAQTLRDEYEQRYATLRMRLVACVLAACSAFVFIVCLVALS